jgi:hypothetical protein
MPGDTGPPGGGPPGGRPGGGLACDSVACVAATTKLINARNAVLQACTEAAAAQAEETVFFTLAAALFAASIACLVGAAAVAAGTLLFGWPASAVLVAVACVLAALATVLVAIGLYFEIQRANAMGRVIAGQATWNDALGDVMTSCPNTCWGNTELPKC